MAHSSLKLLPGVDTTETPALNEAGISTSNLIRFVPDRKSVGLPQKLGGWSRFYQNTIYAVVRALWPWNDTVSMSHLAVGTENAPDTWQTQLSVITNGSQLDITPRYASDNIVPDVETTAGDSIVTITDTTTQNITAFDTVYIPVHIAIGGLILFGLYACDPDGFLASTSYTINITDILGTNVPAVSSETSGALVPELTTVADDSFVTVTLDAHGYNVGDTFPILVPTTVGGVTFYGNYIVQQIVDANNFVIIGTTLPTASTSGFINDGNARFIYGLGVGSIPAGTGYGIGGYGLGGYGTGTAIVPATGTPISASDWTLDNWGQILIACPKVPDVVLDITNVSGSGTVGTITYSTPYTIPEGTGVIVANENPTSWNGTYLADTGGSSTTVNVATTVTDAQVTPGTVTVQNVPFQPVYYWDSESGQPKATIIPQAPPFNEGIFVAMPQRQIIAYGSTFTGIPDPLLVRWCDVNNFYTWSATVINQAGSYRLPRGSKIVGGIQGPQQSLIWTDIALWAMQFVGLPYVYSFNEIGSGCGLIAKKAAGVLNGQVYWMGPSQFYQLTGDGVQPLSCPVWDVIFQDLDTDNLAKIRVAVNSRFGEIAWYYPTIGSGEVTKYVKYNAIIGQWDYGTLARSAWVDQSVLGPPVGADPANLYLYQHETSTDADGQPLQASLTTGLFALGDGDQIMYVDQFWPDFKFGYFDGDQNATINLTFNLYDYPGQNPIVNGPYPVTKQTTYISPRFRSRLMSISISSDDVGSFWRMGNPRYRVAADGKF